MKKKQWIFLCAWFVLYIAAMQFLRFKFGIFQVSGVSFAIGVLIWMIFFQNKGMNSP
jgi:glucan phosphoethanolaminetransferase (alkaline phosphatase superfamily)